MRKTNEAFQIQSSLEKAEQRLAEAIEYAEKAKREADAANVKYGSDDDPVAELKTDIEDRLLEDADTEGKTLYGFAPELSRSRKIKNDISEVPEEKLELLKGILGDSVFEYAIQNAHLNSKETISPGSKRSLEIKKEEKQELLEQLKDELKLDDKLFNEEFHGGYDALKDIAKINEAIANRTNKSVEESILSDSWDYEIKSFNEGNSLDENNLYETPDIMPSDFELYSFDDEDDEAVIPYDVNEALILGEVVPPDFVDQIQPQENIELPHNSLNEEEHVVNLEAEQHKLLEKAELEVEEILGKAKSEAELIIANAKVEAQRLIDEKVQVALDEANQKGYEQGFEKGQREGFIAAEDAVNVGMQEEAEAFRLELKDSLESFEDKKNEILDNNINDLTDLAVTIAEKVINVSLKSSKDVVAKMIIAAAEQCRNKEWAKVYISHEDKSITMNLETGLINALNQISPNVKVVIMDDEPSGTCIIETSDQIVDAGVMTQMENIKQLVKDKEH